jgi:hypothetical protein
VGCGCPCDTRPLAYLSGIVMDRQPATFIRSSTLPPSSSHLSAKV